MALKKRNDVLWRDFGAFKFKMEEELALLLEEWIELVGLIFGPVPFSHYILSCLGVGSGY